MSAGHWLPSAKAVCLLNCPAISPAPLCVFLHPWGYTRFETESDMCPRSGSHTLFSTAVRGVGREESSVPIGTNCAK